MKIAFPAGFLWGAATSAYQIEGSTAADGRGPSIWDRFAALPGKVEDGSNGDVACDHYRRYREDVALMRELGLQAYRFSVSWARVQPTGAGAPNERGLDFYSRLVDALLEAGIAPFATLYHWDMPAPREDAGGWANRATAERFAQYADCVARRLGDRVRHWITHNEPWCTAMLGHQRGIHAPGVQDWPTALTVAHHVLVSHGLSVAAIRSSVGVADSEVGIALNLTPAVPASPSEADRDACRHFDGFFNRWFLDPLSDRGYPTDMVEDYSRLGYLTGGLAFERAGDQRIIAAPTDFLGVNYYMRAVVRSETVAEDDNELPNVFRAPESEHTDMGWEVYPDGLRQVLLDVHSGYSPKKIYVTENGASYADGPGSDGRVRDARRISFLRDHLVATHRALSAGVPVAGYFVWSLLDNFEWDRGYTQRFGIVWVDYETQRRVPKDSAFWYRDVTTANAVALPPNG